MTCHRLHRAFVRLGLCLGIAGLLANRAITAEANDADQAPTNTLNPEQIAEGWLLLFDGHSTLGWTVDAEGPNEAVSVEDGVLSITGPATVKTNTEFAEFGLHTEVQAQGDDNWRLVLQGPDEGVTRELIPNPTQDGPNSQGQGSRYVLRVGSERTEGRAESDDGSRLQFVAERPENAPVKGAIAFQVGDGTTVSVRNLRLRPLNMTSLFHGRDLSGWNVLPSGDSVYQVTEDGHLNVTNGRGDIQTEGQYDDFILQLDIYVNGEDLNSGIFFRAIPGEFWSGYESQIRNQYKGDDRTQPVDYGTGGIYRRQAARKIVADDFEWFTKTIVADDDHFAVWVDGYQVSDWTDDRPKADNGRNGLKLSPGVISIQGHDPTTDLSFRNIRIQELPEQATTETTNGAEQ